MNTQKLIKGFAALFLLSVPVAGIGCVGNVDSESQEAVAEAEEAINPTTACPQGPGPLLVSTGAASSDPTDGLYAGACATAAIGGGLLRLIQYGLEITAPTDLGQQCLDYCTDGGRFAACGVGWRLDSAAADPVVTTYFSNPLDTANLGPLTRRALLGQSTSGSQEVTCLDRPDVNAAGDDAHQWVAICTCSNLQ